MKPILSYKVVNDYREFLTNAKQLVALRAHFAKLVGPITNVGACDNAAAGPKADDSHLFREAPWHRSRAIGDRVFALQYCTATNPPSPKGLADIW